MLDKGMLAGKCPRDFTSRENDKSESSPTQELSEVS